MRKIFLGGDSAGNAYDFVRHMQHRDGTPATGLVLTGFISATKTGAAIHATLSKSLVEGDAVGDYQEYTATAAASDLLAQLAPYAGKVVYDRCTGSGYDDYEPVLVVAARPAGE